MLPSELVWCLCCYWYLIDVNNYYVTFLYRAYHCVEAQYLYKWWKKNFVLNLKTNCSLKPLNGDFLLIDEFEN